MSIDVKIGWIANNLNFSHSYILGIFFLFVQLTFIFRDLGIPVRSKSAFRKFAFFADYLFKLVM